MNGKLVAKVGAVWSRVRAEVSSGWVMGPAPLTWEPAALFVAGWWHQGRPPAAAADVIAEPARVPADDGEHAEAGR